MLLGSQRLCPAFLCLPRKCLGSVLSLKLTPPRGNPGYVRGKHAQFQITYCTPPRHIHPLLSWELLTVLLQQPEPWCQVQAGQPRAGRKMGEPWPSGAEGTPSHYPPIWSDDPAPLLVGKGILGPFPLSPGPGSFDLTSASGLQHPSPQCCPAPPPDSDA